MMFMVCMAVGVWNLVLAWHPDNRWWPINAIGGLGSLISAAYWWDAP